MFASLQFKLELKREDKEKLIKLMRKQSSAIRMAYNMLKELEKEKTRNPHTHLQRKQEKNLKNNGRELRQGTLIGIRSKHKTAQGNLLLRFMELDGKPHLRITTGNREFIYAKVLREPRRMSTF